MNCLKSFTCCFSNSNSHCDEPEEVLLTATDNDVQKLKTEVNQLQRGLASACGLIEALTKEMISIRRMYDDIQKLREALKNVSALSAGNRVNLVDSIDRLLPEFNTMPNTSSADSIWNELGTMSRYPAEDLQQSELDDEVDRIVDEADGAQ